MKLLYGIALVVLSTGAADPALECRRLHQSRRSTLDNACRIQAEGSSDLEDSALLGSSSTEDSCCSHAEGELQRPVSCKYGSADCGKAIDGDSGTYYSLPAKSGRLEMDLGATKVVSAVQVYKHPQAGSNGMNQFDIEVKSGSSWKVVQSFTSPYSAGGWKEFSLSKPTEPTRYVAFNIKSNFGNSYTSVRSIKFRTACGSSAS